MENPTLALKSFHPTVTANISTPLARNCHMVLSTPGGWEMQSFIYPRRGGRQEIVTTIVGYFQEGKKRNKATDFLQINEEEGKQNKRCRQVKKRRLNSVATQFNCSSE